MDKKEHILSFSVRDYELDLQGIVNNAVYQNYLEHARHEMLRSAGLDFAQMHEEGYDAVVIRAEIDYKRSLRSGEHFEVITRTQREGRLRIIFLQEIVRSSDKALMVQAKIITACVHKGRPVEPLNLLDKLGLL